MLLHRRRKRWILPEKKVSANQTTLGGGEETIHFYKRNPTLDLNNVTRRIPIPEPPESLAAGRYAAECDKW